MDRFRAMPANSADLM